MELEFHGLVFWVPARKQKQKHRVRSLSGPMQLLLKDSGWALLSSLLAGARRGLENAVGINGESHLDLGNSPQGLRDVLNASEVMNKAKSKVYASISVNSEISGMGFPEL